MQLGEWPFRRESSRRAIPESKRAAGTRAANTCSWFRISVVGFVARHSIFERRSASLPRALRPKCVEEDRGFLRREEIAVVVDFRSRDGNRFHMRATRKGRVVQHSPRLPESCSTLRRRADSVAVVPGPLVLAASARCPLTLRRTREECLAYGCE